MVESPALHRLYAIKRVVGSDPVDPRRQLGCTIKPFDFTKNREEHFLRNISSLFLGTKKSKAKIEDPVLIKSYELRKGIGVSKNERLNKVGFVDGEMCRY